MVENELQLRGELLDETQYHRLERLLEVLSQTDLEHLPDGRYSIEEDALYFFVQTAPEEVSELQPFETHTVQADVQYLISGTLIMDFCHKDTLQEAGPYDEKNDITFYGKHSTYTRLQLRRGEAIVIMPHHGHRTIFPSEAQSGSFRRVIGKLRLVSAAQSSLQNTLDGQNGSVQ